jgi:choline dehydrogenase-like flavoprotein|tara:strand:- start:608 stop:2176 length:1569 start_codon:yes stop_codon:yes gene_type:complete
MLTDSRSLPSGSVVNADVCIIGAGAAGITLAQQFANTRVKVCLMESGGFDLDLHTQDLYRGKSVGWPYWPLEASRIRFFGGSTNHWGGACIPLNRDDFETRDWVPNSGWPFSKSDLNPFYNRALSVFGLNRNSFDPYEWEAQGKRVLPLNSEAIVSNMHQSCNNRRFGLTYKDELMGQENLDTYTHANAVNLRANNPVQTVSKVEFATMGGNAFSVRAKFVILAMGGIENSRLLLASTDDAEAGLGNQNDLVGRYFSDHYYFSNVGRLVVANPDVNLSMYTRKVEIDGQQIGVHFELSSDERKLQRLLTTRIHVGDTSWRAYARDHGRPRRSTDLSDKIVNRIDGILRKVRGVDGTPGNTAEDYGENKASRLFSVGAWSEVIPRSDSRVLLNDEKDALGMRRITLDWRIGAAEKRSVINSLTFFGRQLGVSGVGRFRLDLDEESPWPWEGGGTPGMHHMGGTRMNNDPVKGVVDGHSKVHGLSNLYVAGSSVFPTFGTANPTLTIVALAIRMGDHIKERLNA